MFGKLLDVKREGNKLIIDFQEKRGIVEIINPQIINLHEEKTSDFRIQRESDFNDFQWKLIDNQLLIVTTEYTFKITDDFQLSVYNDDKLISTECQFEQKMQADANYELLRLEGHEVNQAHSYHTVAIHKVINKNDCLYGLGEKTGFLNKRGYDYEMWNTDNPAPHVDNFKALYKSIPFYITFSKDYCYGFFVDNSYKQFYDMAKTREDVVSISFDKGCFNYYFIGGNSLKNVVMNYTLITGRTPLPQRFTLGHQQSRWSYMNADELMTVADKYRELKIPCDVLFLDIDYMDKYKVFTYDDQSFKDFPELIKKLSAKGYKLVTIVDPGVKYEKGYKVCDEAIENGYVATLNNETYINEVWPGEAVFPSFIDEKVRLWWQGNIKFLTDCGVAGIWNDMNEPASFKGPLPDNVEFKANGKTYYHDEIHNLYGHYMAISTYDGLKKHTNRRPYIITRACYAGTQKYSTIWTGDNHSIWAHLEMAVPMLLNLGMSGFAFVGTDVGGFGSDCTKELLCRWVELGAFTPLFRNHSAMGTRRQEPWTFDVETIDIYRKAVSLRYELIPYFYDLYYEASKDGLPLLRPLVMNYENDKETYELNDEFMLGDDIIVAPVLKQGITHRMIYLPVGRWFDYFTKKEYPSGYQVVEAQLADIPVFVKEGAIIPQCLVESHIENPKELILDIYPGRGKYLHYQDNGEDFKYQNGEYNLYEISHIDNKVSIVLLHNGYQVYSKIVAKYLGVSITIDKFGQEFVIE